MYKDLFIDIKKRYRKNMMQLVYSAFGVAKDPVIQRGLEAESDLDLLRLQAYKTVCKKYEQEITAIKQWMPNWQPEFRLADKC